MRQEEQVKTGEEQRRAKILVVEDEPNMVVGLRDNFEFEGYEVITARDGVEGLQLALEESPDLVVLDGNPAAKIEDVEKVETVFKDGVGYDPAKLRASVAGLVGIR